MRASNRTYPAHDGGEQQGDGTDAVVASGDLTQLSGGGGIAS
jgi:hypothetical protein